MFTAVVVVLSVLLFPRSVPGLSQLCPRSVPALSQVCPRSVPGLSQVCPRSVPGLSQLCPRSVPGLASTFQIEPFLCILWYCPVLSSPVQATPSLLMGFSMTQSTGFVQPLGPRPFLYCRVSEPGLIMNRIREHL
jgi:hypothetical protein